MTGYLNIQDFGVVGDGSDETAAIQAFFDQVPKRWTAIIPPVESHYGVTSITLPRGITIKGHGCDLPNLTAKGGSVFSSLHQSADVFRIQDVREPVIFDGIGIGSTISQRQGNGIYFEATHQGGVNSRSGIRNCAITDQFRGVFGNGISCLSVLNNFFGSTEMLSNNTLGIILREQFNPDGGDHLIDGNSFSMRGGVGTAFMWQSGGGCRFVNNKVLFGENGVVLTSNGGTPFLSGQFAVVGNQFDGQSNDAIRFSNANVQDRYFNTAVTGNAFFGPGTGNFIEIGGNSQAVYRAITITGNGFHVNGGGNAPAVQLYQCGDVTVTGNAFVKENGGGSYGIRNQGAANFSHGDNVYSGFATPVG